MTTIDAYVERYVALRDTVKAIAAEHAEALAPYEQAMQAIAGEVLRFLNETGQDSAKTPSGTAYKSHKLSAKVVDREAFMAFVFEEHRDAFLIAGVAKEAVKDFMDANAGQTPPGVEIVTFVDVNFRRA